MYMYIQYSRVTKIGMNEIPFFFFNLTFVN